MTHTPSPDALARRYFDMDAASLDAEERAVLKGIHERRPISQDATEIAEAQATFWDRLADRVAAVGGSWGFIFAFFAVLIVWVLLNTGVFRRLGLTFDPYPFIFLNLMLSMLAAIQAPIIMMSQNRQAEKDRLAATHDYEVNLRAELEILRLHEKIDALRIEHLEAIQRLQSDLLESLAKKG